MVAGRPSGNAPILAPDRILEPLSTGDIIDRSVRIYRHNVRPLLATVLFPFMVGTLGWLMVQFGKANMSLAAGGEFSLATTFVLVTLGLVLTLAYAYLMVLAVAGLSRTVGDHLMLGEPITVRATFRAIRSRLADLTIGSLILAGSSIVGAFIAMTVLFIAFMVIGIVSVTISALEFPPTIAGVLAVLVLLAALGAVFLVVVPYLLARVIFIPQAIMIEGCSATTAFSRSMELGAKNWSRVLAILVFSYFTSLSLAAAVISPIALLAWLSGFLNFEAPTVEAVSGGVQQFSSFLVVPVWSIAYTLLYFDSRVRAEGYDVDLLARRLPAPPSQRPAPQSRPQVFPYGPAAASMAASPAFAPVKFASDGRCLRCGRYNLFNSPSCPGCGW